MIRRGLTRGFWPAYAIGRACSGDFGARVALGAGAVAEPPAAPGAGRGSLALLLFLAWTFPVRAWRSWRRHRRGEAEPAAGASTAPGRLLLARHGRRGTSLSGWR
jgi:hypothetical protein